MRGMKPCLISPLFALLLNSAVSYAAPAGAPEEGEVATCDDAEAWASLESLRGQYKGTDGEQDIEYLYHLRVFICREIAAGRLEYKNAEPLFDSEKQRIVEEWSRGGPDPADLQM